MNVGLIGSITSEVRILEESRPNRETPWNQILKMPFTERGGERGGNQSLKMKRDMGGRRGGL